MPTIFGILLTRGVERVHESSSLCSAAMQCIVRSSSSSLLLNTSMILGHFAAAFAARRLAPETSLGTTIFAALFLDLLWPVLLLLDVEQVRIAPGLMAASPLDFTHYPYSHSLLVVGLWAVLLGGGYYALRRMAGGAMVVGGLVLSHWFLDVPMHRADLPLWPGSELKLGAGLWNSVPATIAVELGLFTLGLIVYLRCTRPVDPIGRYALGALCAFLLLIFLSGLFGSAPPSEQAVAIVTLGLWLFVPWGYWIGRHRENVDGASTMVAYPRPLRQQPKAGLR